jgi:hypothetical protein
MLKKKISELEPKTDLAPTDAIPVVDTELARKKTKKTTIADIVTAVDAVPNESRGVPGGVATLDETTGQLPAEQLPPEATVETFNVISEAAMLALSAQQGDIVIRNDLNKTFILAGNNPASLSQWQEIIMPTPNLTSLPDVSSDTPDVKAALVYDPETNLWRSADIAKLTDGGFF